MINLTRSHFCIPWVISPTVKSPLNNCFSAQINAPHHHGDTLGQRKPKRWTARCPIRIPNICASGKRINSCLAAVRLSSATSKAPVSMSIATILPWFPSSTWERTILTESKQKINKLSWWLIGKRCVNAVTHLKSNIVGFRCLNPTYKIGDRTWI